MIETRLPPASSPGNQLPLHPPTSGAALVAPHSDVLLPAGVRCLALSPTWTLEHGAVLADARLAYELSGPPDAPVVVVQGGISASCHVTSTPERPEPGWWQPIVGAGAAVDTTRYRVLAYDYLGGNGASSGPRNSAATNGGDFPTVTTNDQARALAALLDALGLERVEAFAGASYGGMVALAFAALFPRRLRRLVVLSAAHRSHPQSIAWRSLQRKIVRLARRQGDARTGLVLSRGLAMVTYRTPEELRQRFDRSPRHGAAGFTFPVDEYLEARGRAFAESFDPAAFLCLSESIDLHRVDPSTVTAPSTLVAVRSDQLVPIEEMWSLKKTLRRPARWIEVPSLYGHDAFLKETETVSKIFAEVFPSGGEA